MKNIIPCWWFDRQAEAAANFYVSVFKDARMGRITRYGKAGRELHGKPEGSAMTVAFEIEGSDETAQQCGWLKDRYGLSWQIVPVVLPDMLNDPDRRKSERVMNALLQMKKIDIEALRRAYDQA